MITIAPETWSFICEHHNEDVRILALQSQKYKGVDMSVALVQIAGWQTAARKVPSWSKVKELLYPVHLSLEQCSSESTALFKAEIIKAMRTASSDISPENVNKEQKENDGSNSQAIYPDVLTTNTQKEQIIVNPSQSTYPNIPTGSNERKEKQECIPFKKSGSFADLTGGMGVDCSFIAQLFSQATYVERQQELCEIASHNFPLLGLDYIQVIHADGSDYLKQMEPVDWLFIDPARRDGHGGKVIAIADCEPDVVKLEPLLLTKARHIMVKLSPMLDLSQAMRDLKQIEAAYVVSVDNECKELLLILGHQPVPLEQVPIHCINLKTENITFSFTFTRQQESDSDCSYTSQPEAYLYEPNAAILKAGAFKSIATVYQLKKLHPNSHLYTSSERIEDFPGRSFHIDGVSSLNKKELSALLSGVKKANLSIRNFPTTTTALSKKLNLADGGNIYLFATTLTNDRKAIIRCRKP